MTNESKIRTYDSTKEVPILCAVSCLENEQTIQFYIPGKFIASDKLDEMKNRYFHYVYETTKVNDKLSRTLLMVYKFRHCTFPFVEIQTNDDIIADLKKMDTRIMMGACIMTHNHASLPKKQ